MRIVFVGVNPMTIAASRILTRSGHEVVIVDADRSKLSALPEDLDVGLLNGDGTRPALLREADPSGTDFLFCLTESDQANLIASLVGRSLGFNRIVTRIEDPEFEHIALELGLTDTIVPARTIGRYLADLVKGSRPVELSAAIKGDARIFVFVAREEDEGSVEDLGLPPMTKATHLYRDDAFQIVESGTRIATGDEVVVVTNAKGLELLESRWSDQEGARGERPPSS
jgi:trk system potassium uptake protein TrkA